MEKDSLQVYKTIYGAEEGKLIFIEQMIVKKHLDEGKSFVDLEGMKGLPSPAVNHTNIGFIPTGHKGFEVPHYHIHPYFISPEESDVIQGAPILTDYHHEPNQHK